MHTRLVHTNLTVYFAWQYYRLFNIVFCHEVLCSIAENHFIYFDNFTNTSDVSAECVLKYSNHITVLKANFKVFNMHTRESIKTFNTILDVWTSFKTASVQIKLVLVLYGCIGKNKKKNKKSIILR